MNISDLFAKAATNPNYVPKSIGASSVCPGGANVHGQTVKELTEAIFNRMISGKVLGSIEDMQREANDRIIRAVQAAGGDWNVAADMGATRIWSGEMRERVERVLAGLRNEFGENPALMNIIDSWKTSLENQKQLAAAEAVQISQNGISVAKAKSIIDKHGWPRVMKMTEFSDTSAMLDENIPIPPAVAETSFILSEIQRNTHHAHARLRELEAEFFESLAS